MSPYSLAFNGINGSTGEYLLPSLTRLELARSVRRRMLRRAAADDRKAELRTRGLAPGVEVRELATTGWGVIFAQNVDRGVRDKLGKLLNRRQEQAGKYYRGDLTFLPGDTARSWLVRQKVGPGPVDPRRLPYFLLIVGDPQAVPFEFQFQLGARYAVGRLFFKTAAEYAAYASSVLQAETDLRLPRRQAAFFGVHNTGDEATNFATKYLMKPLLEELQPKSAGWEWQLTEFLGEKASKARLGRLLGGDETPDLLFTTSHGMGFNKDDPRLPHHLGALLCHDWPGPQFWREHHSGKRIPQKYYFSAEDVTEEADLTGLIAFHFACFSAGVPHLDSFAHGSDGSPRVLSPEALLAPLPQRLLGKPGGGALAVIGHVDRARGFSFIWPGAGCQPQTFQAILERLMTGYPVGAATGYLGQRYAEICMSVNEILDELGRGKSSDETELADMWTALVDARSYIVLGDPAVRLKV